MDQGRPAISGHHFQPGFPAPRQPPPSLMTGLHKKKAPSEDGANPWRNADEDITGVGYLPTEV